MKIFIAVVVLAIASIVSAELDSINPDDDFSVGKLFKPLVENIVGVRNGTYTHHCTIYIRIKGKWSFVSGSLIAPNLVLTLASSFKHRVDEVRVFYGSNKLASSKMVKGKRFHRHSRFNGATLTNNLGIVELVQPIASNLTKPILLPPAACRNTPFDGQYIAVVGFGANGETLNKK